MPVPVLDGHNDALRRALKSGDGVAALLDGGEDAELDLVRAQAGGFRAGLFACFAAPLEQEFPHPPSDRPPDPLTPEPYSREGAREQTARMLAIAAAVEEASPDQFRIARSHADLVAAIDHGGPLTAVLHLEGAEAIDPSLSDLEEWIDRGVRSIGPVWSRANAFGEGVPFAFGASPDSGAGLTDAGRALVRRCASLSILIDLAHMNGPGFWDVARLDSQPLVVSHTAAFSIAPTARNLTDAQLRAIGASGGLVGLTFHIGDLRRDGIYDTDVQLDLLVDHLEHFAEHAGIEAVALGSDFDGAVMPSCVRDATALPALLEALASRGFSAAEVAAIAHGNWLRVLRGAFAA